VRLLLVRARNGEEAAFEVLFDVCKGRVYSTCMAVARLQRDAEELTTQVFLTLFRNLKACKEVRDFVKKMDSLAAFLSSLHMRKRTSQMVREPEQRVKPL